jgi:hypothetical protein
MQNNIDQIARTVMKKLDLVTSPDLSEAQLNVLRELYMPGYIRGQEGIQREVTESGQIIDFIEGNTVPGQTYNNKSNNGIAATATRREVLNGYIVNFVEK